MLGVVRDARHHLGAAEALRILKRSVRDQLAGFEIEQPQDDGRGAEVHRDAMDRPGRALHFDAVDQDAIAIARDRGIELRPADRSPAVPTRGARCACARGAWCGSEPARSSPVTNVWQDRRKFPLRCCSGSVSAERAVHPLDDFDHALFALALLAARRGNIDPSASAWSNSESPLARLDGLPVDGERDGHCREVPTSPSLRVRPSMLPPLRAPSRRALLPRSISTAPGSRRQPASPRLAARISICSMNLSSSITVTSSASSSALICVGISCQ